jgi:hypothetical protein
MRINQVHAAQTIGGEIDKIGTIEIPSSAADAGTKLSNLFSVLFSMLTFIAGLAFAIYFVLGALKWLTGGGDAQKVEGAKNQMTQAAIGLIIVVASYAIIAIVSTVLGLNILNPSTILNTLD